MEELGIISGDEDMTDIEFVDEKPVKNEKFMKKHVSKKKDKKKTKPKVNLKISKKQQTDYANKAFKILTTSLKRSASIVESVDKKNRLYLKGLSKNIEEKEDVLTEQIKDTFAYYSEDSEFLMELLTRPDIHLGVTLANIGVKTVTDNIKEKNDLLDSDKDPVSDLENDIKGNKNESKLDNSW